MQFTIVIRVFLIKIEKKPEIEIPPNKSMKHDKKGVNIQPR